MYKLYDEKDSKICFGKAFELRAKDDLGKVIETIFVNLSGEVIKLEHDGSIYYEEGSRTFNPDDAEFTDNVKHFMRALFQQNIYEFQRMRNSLNTRWRNLAEEIRSKASA